MATHELHGTGSAPVLPEAGGVEVGPAGAEMRRFLGMRFWDVDLRQAARFLVQCAISGTRQQVYFVNAHCVNVAARDPDYARLIAGAPFLFADGVGMALAARLWGAPLHNNVNGTDLFPLICEHAAERGVPIALLGARPGVAQVCARRMQDLFPGLQIAWVDHGYHPAEEEESRLRDLNRSGAQIMFVARGVPQQERWIAANWMRLRPPVVLGVGALFDFYSGSVPRAPRMMRELRLEWAFRLLLEPRRLFHRYVVGNPAFLARAMLRRMAGG